VRFGFGKNAGTGTFSLALFVTIIAKYLNPDSFRNPLSLIFEADRRTVSPTPGINKEKPRQVLNVSKNQDSLFVGEARSSM